MVLGMIFLITLIDTTYDFKRKVSYNRYHMVGDKDGVLKIDMQTGDTWYSFVGDYDYSNVEKYLKMRWYPFKSNSDYQSWKLNQNEKPNKD